ncbi:MAG: hypothetical protein IKO83_09440 [Oscillospiraceae bacterium]|nr:hypothetical protein [Oscillospiraceae bacterium]
MARFDVTMKHGEDSLFALAHMQYDLFCTRNFIARNLLSAALILLGAYFMSRVWGIFLILYGIYLMTSTYASSNHTVRKLIAQIEASGKGYPSSRYRFEEKRIAITFHPGQKDEEELAPVSYGDLIKLGEDGKYFYLFPNPHGGYCIPKGLLNGKQKEFAAFLEEKTGQRFYRRRPSPLRRLREWMRRRAEEPEHL